MRRHTLLLLAGTLVAADTLCSPTARADEGMWLFTNPPVEPMRRDHGWAPDARWLARAQRAAVKFPGGSGSFVSPDGLVMTNHHVGSGAIADVSSPEHNYLRDGFAAPTQEQELRCPGLTLEEIIEIVDVTGEIDAAIRGAKDPQEADRLRRRAISDIENRQKDKTGLVCSVVTLFGGARYHLHCAKQFTDVRLVFAPEESAAFFGGDNDNFEFPRYNIDVCFFRVYENDRPYRPQEHLRFASEGPALNELVLVVGNPGRTERTASVDDLKFRRDVELPMTLSGLWRTEVKMTALAGRSREHARQASEVLFAVANVRKRLTGELSTLLDPAVMSAKERDERQLRERIDADASLRQRYADAWDRVREAHDALRPWYTRYATLEHFRGSTLLRHAMTIVRLAMETPKPSGERLPEFRDARLPDVRSELVAPAPVPTIRERARLGDLYTFWCERLGADDPLPQAARRVGPEGTDTQGGPEAWAQAVIERTRLGDADERARLASLTLEELQRCDDPLIRLALAIEPENRAVRERYRREVESVTREAYARIARARFEVLGDGVYPDATGTLRLAYGTIAGYRDSEGEVPAWTVIGGTYERARARAGETGFELPPSWLGAQTRVNPDTPFNFVCTADTVGGNSGSPALNTRGELVGIVFDGNIHTLGDAVVFDAVRGRSLCVDVRGIVECLDKIYGANWLLEEIQR